MRTHGTEYRGTYIIKHEAPNPLDTFFTVVLGGIVWKHYSMPDTMAAVDKWLDN